MAPAGPGRARLAFRARMVKNANMKIANLSFAAGPEGLMGAVAHLSDALGARFKDGGFHPRFGTRNHILPMTRGQYIEVVEVLEHPAAEKAPFGQAVRARTEMGGGWLAWVIAVDDITPLEERLGRPSALGSRQFPDGRRLEWKQIGVKGLLNDPQLPYFIQWTSDESTRPCALGEGVVELLEIELAGSAARVNDWLGLELGPVFSDVSLKFSAPNGNPGIDAVTFRTPKGVVRL